MEVLVRHGAVAKPNSSRLLCLLAYLLYHGPCPTFVLSLCIVPQTTYVDTNHELP